MQSARVNWPGFNAAGMNGISHYAIPVALIAGLGILLHTVTGITLALVAAIVSVLLAYHFPRVTIGLTILLGQVMQFELAPLFGISPEGIALGSINLRLSDPLVFGITVTVLLRLAGGDKSAIRFCRKEGLFLILFLLYLLIHVASSTRVFGASAPGEFRTYYQFLLFVPYVVVSTKMEQSRRSLFVMLLCLSILQIVWGVLRGAILFGFTFSAYEKWLSGFGSLALLYGVYAFSSVCRQRLLLPGPVLKVIVYAGSIGMILISGARAVWFAGICSLLVLALRGRVSMKQAMKGAVISGIAVAAIYPVFVLSGLDPMEYVGTRLLAFTDFSADPTAAWRYSFWVSTVDEILKNPWFGSGFGVHFDIYISEFRELITTSPHNLYLSILFQVGLVGLFLYGFLIVPFFLRFSNPGSLSVVDNAIVATGVLVLTSVHAYGIAYSFEKDFFSWLYIGLAISAIIQEVPDQISAKPRTIKRIP